VLSVVVLDVRAIVKAPLSWVQVKIASNRNRRTFIVEDLMELNVTVLFHVVFALPSTQELKNTTVLHRNVVNQKTRRKGG
jgi:hypothetical protein